MPFGNYRGITAGPDGRLWFVDKDGDKVVAMTTAGVVSVIPLPMGSTPQEIVTGPDGNLWVTLHSRQVIARVTPAGQVTEFPLPSGGGNPAGITVGPDGALWFAENTAARVGRMTTAGVVTEIPLPGRAARSLGHRHGPRRRAVDRRAGREPHRPHHHGRSASRRSRSPPRAPSPSRSSSGPSGVLWFTENGRDRIGQVGPASIASGISPIREFAYDATPPAAKLTVGPSAAGVLPLRVRCSEKCSVLAELVAAPALARKLGVAGADRPSCCGTDLEGAGRAPARPVRAGEEGLGPRGAWPRAAAGRPPVSAVAVHIRAILGDPPDLNAGDALSGPEPSERHRMPPVSAVASRRARRPS